MHCQFVVREDDDSAHWNGDWGGRVYVCGEVLHRLDGQKQAKVFIVMCSKCGDVSCVGNDAKRETLLAVWKGEVALGFCNNHRLLPGAEKVYARRKNVLFVPKVSDFVLEYDFHEDTKSCKGYG